MEQVGEMEWESIEERSLKDSIYKSLAKGERLSWEEVKALVTTIQQLLVSNPRMAEPVFDVLLYYLERGGEVEREPVFDVLLYYLERGGEVERGNIIHVVGQVVVEEAAAHQAPHAFTDVVKQNINLLSHGCDRECNRVRSCLHACIREWIHLEVVPTQFLLDLQGEERRWSFTRPTPKFPVPQEQDPGAFDLAMIGIARRGMDACYRSPASMTALVQNGMKHGVQEGWLCRDANGHQSHQCSLRQCNMRSALQDVIRNQVGANRKTEAILCL